ncbi:MAG: DUF1997 domain-containing protein [Candidatus Sericytochromatia bacterium]|nr:DUF1997 domain-containing protein [Candidatus Tanganyikabacteria bacterium]
MHIAARATRAVVVSAPPEAVALYFSRNERLLSRLVGPGRVLRLEDGLYRVSLRTFEALGLAVRPVLDVRFVDAPRLTTMEGLECRAVEGPAGLALDVSLSGTAHFQPHPGGCRIACVCDASADISLPFPLNLLPARALEAAAQPVLAAAMEAAAARFEHLIAADFAEPQAIAA